MVKRRHSTWPVPKSIAKMNMITKKAQATAQVSEEPTPVCADVSLKLRRTLMRRSVLFPKQGAQAVSTKSGRELSTLYNGALSDPYINQLYVKYQKIGGGSFGNVFVAYSEEDREYCAIKITNDSHPLVDFGEVKRWEKVPTNEHCVQFKRAWFEDNHLYIHMELCVCSLDKLLEENHFVREKHCWDILLDVCRGLKNLHDNNLIHMDIKPANIMISNEGKYKLGDYGLLCDLNEKGDTSNKSGLSISEGDGKYVALEVLQEGMQTKAADIFSLGLTMLEVASDVVLPSSGVHWQGLRNGKLPLCYLRRKLSHNFRSLIKSMIQKNHSLRPSVDDILGNKTMLGLIDEQNNGQRINYVVDLVNARDTRYPRPPLRVVNSPRNNDVGPSHVPHLLADTPRLPTNENEDPMRLLDASSRLSRVSRRLFD